MTETPHSIRDRWIVLKRRVRTFGRRILPVVWGALGAVIILFLYNLVTPKPTLITQRDVQNTVVQAMASATPPPAWSAQVYQIIQPSLVLVETQIGGGAGGNVKYESDDDGGFYPVQSEEGSGAGVIVNDAGDILTSLHVVATAADLRVTFADGSTSKATVAGTLPDSDIAVLKADTLPDEFVPAVLGNPNAMRIGDEAYVVGHPFGLNNSMSAGVISGLHRTYQPPSGTEMKDLIQFDAATNPGNSGGPLLNRYGQVVGIVSMLLNPTKQNVFIGIGFAVPITTAGGAAGLPPK
ncbi:MAG: trypsin-like peptidase domain-containing protein [Chloroflexota bacterium]